MLEQMTDYSSSKISTITHERGIEDSTYVFESFYMASWVKSHIVAREDQGGSNDSISLA